MVAMRAEGTLRATSSPGVEIEIVDADFQVRARGVGQVEALLPQGVYMVNGLAAGQMVQELVRLLPIEKPLEVTLKAPMGLAQSTTETLQSLRTPSRGKSPHHRSEIVVLLQSALGSKAGKSVSLRLLDRNDVAMRSDEKGVEALRVQSLGDNFARVYGVDGGAFRLQYVSSAGETMHQYVPALEGRRTFVFMVVSEGSVLTRDGDGFARVSYLGVDPARTVIVSLPLAYLPGERNEALRIGEILLHDLAAGRGALGASLVCELSRTEADPLLKLYGAALILRQLERRGSPSLDEPWPQQPSDEAAFRMRWTRLARDWLAGVSDPALRADATACGWRLGGVSGRKTLPSPPMLECSWLWAAVHSITDPRAVPASVAFRGAVRGTIGATPWLAWRAAAGKGPVSAATAQAQDLLDLMKAVEQRLLALQRAESALPAETKAPSPSDTGGFLDRGLLSPETRTLAVRTLRYLAEARAQELDDPLLATAQSLALDLAAPAPALMQRLQQFLNEIDVASSGPQEAPARRAPGLRRAITCPDDPHKSRFGGLSERNGYKVTAIFAPGSSRNWVDVTLKVEASNGALAARRAAFYLHDSFDPDRYIEPFVAGVASLDVTAWGGFTLGVWIPDASVELELDLAQLPGAPRIIRER